MDDYLAISALQHYAYCPRQFALIHIEQAWDENRFTAEGRLLHDRVDQGAAEQRRGLRYERAVSLISQDLRLIGKMDLLEIHIGSNGQPDCYFPVEYKRGKPKLEDWDRIQLCAQALCIEEMRKTKVLEGAIWYWEGRRRQPVEMDRELRITTLTAIDGASPENSRVLKDKSPCRGKKAVLPDLGPLERLLRVRRYHTTDCPVY